MRLPLLLALAARAEPDNGERLADCENYSWRFENGKGAIVGCDWVARRADRRCRKTNTEGVTARSACRATCTTCLACQGECCDSASWSIEPNKDCGWVASKRGRRCFETADGVAATEACPASCGTCAMSSQILDLEGQLAAERLALNQCQSEPTCSPTFAPTVEPTTAEPTAGPTATPTADPTFKPTADPTAKPTADPTAKPTADPTARPTAQPTDPTAKPTVDPTAAPTAFDDTFIGSLSAQQVRGVAGHGYADHEKYMSLAVATSFFSYSMGEVGGGSILDVYDNVCWTGGFSADYGAPHGVLHQFYYEPGDNLAYIVHLEEQASGGDLVVVNFRGTQGLTSLTTWLVNFDTELKDFTCPLSTCDDADPYGDGCAPEPDECQVHSGFRTSYDGLVGVGLVDVLKTVIDEITAAGAYPKVLVTGHSLGAALGTIAAFDFALERDITVFGLYTQGSPRVFETLTRNYLESQREFPVWRSTFGNDPVVRVPDSYNYRHVGVEVHADGFLNSQSSWGNVSSYAIGDGSGEDDSLTYSEGFDLTIADPDAWVDHGPGASYLVMHNATVATDEDAPCVGWASRYPKDYGDTSCAARCAAKTESKSPEHDYYGNGPYCGLLGGICDDNCHHGYCTFAPERFTDYPNGPFDFSCGAGNGRICCCEEFRQNETIHSHVHS